MMNNDLDFVFAKSKPLIFAFYRPLRYIRSKQTLCIQKLLKIYFLSHFAIFDLIINFFKITKNLLVLNGKNIS